MASAMAVRGMAWVTRNFHGLPGRWRLVRWLDDHEADVAGLPPQTVRFGGDYRMRVHPVDENGRRVFVHGFEARERLTRHFVRLLHPGDCVLDIGANVGYYTMVAAKLVGPGGCVHAFEASPQTFCWLKANARLNPAADIHVHDKAVSDECGEVTFHTAKEACTGYSSIRDLGAETGSVARVPSVSIDSILNDLPPVRLVKIDVEGAEMLVLRGMSGLIERDQPFVIFEVDDGFLRELGFSAQDLCDFMTQRGYHLHRIVARGDLEPLDGAPGERSNVLACPRTAEGLAAGRAGDVEYGPAPGGFPS